MAIPANSKELISTTRRRRATLGAAGRVLIADSRPIGCVRSTCYCSPQYGRAELGGEGAIQLERSQCGQEPGKPDPTNDVGQLKYHGTSRINELLNEYT
jgi:hypothetical protein